MGDDQPVSQPVPIPTLDDPFYGVDDVAKLFSVTPSQVREWVKDGKMRGYKVLGRIRILKSEVERVVKEEYGS